MKKGVTSMLNRGLKGAPSPAEKMAKLKLKLIELKNFKDSQPKSDKVPNNDLSATESSNEAEVPFEITDKISKYIEQTKNCLIGDESTEQEKLNYALALLNTVLYGGNTSTNPSSTTLPVSVQSQNHVAQENSINIENSSNTNQKVQFVVHFAELQKQNMVSHLIFSLHLLPFECKKQVSLIVNCLFHKKDYDVWNQQIRIPMLDYFQDNSLIIAHLLSYYSEDSLHIDALTAGDILREICRNERLAKLTLQNHWERLINLANLSGFDKLSDALHVFNDLLTRHKPMASKFLSEKNEAFFTKFNKELIGTNSNFVTKKQCIKMLAQILSSKENYRIMLAYVTSAENLKVIMKLLQDSSTAIQLEAFHVFKIFVANPYVEKAEKVARILFKNKQILVDFLKNFLNEKHEEETFDEFEQEKKYLINKIGGLQDPSANKAKEVGSQANE